MVNQKLDLAIILNFSFKAEYFAI